jgi:plastocyanin domain-containing protein
MPKPVRAWLLRATIILVGLGALAGAPQLVGSRKQVQEVTLVARDMAFTREGSEEENPEIRVKAGQRVRIRFRNEDPGIDHILDLPELAVQSPLVKPGQEALLDFLPKLPGRTSYECTLHSRMMRGNLVIEP